MQRRTAKPACSARYLRRGIGPAPAQIRHDDRLRDDASGLHILAHPAERICAVPERVDGTQTAC